MQDAGEAGVAVKSAVLCDPATGRTDNLGFSQPVSVDDLKVVQILPQQRKICYGTEDTVTSGCLE